MDNEKNTTENNQNDSEMKSKSEGGKTAVIVAAALMAGIFSGIGIYKFRANDVKTAEADNQVTTIAVTSDHVSETEEVTEKETTAVTTVTEPAQTTAGVSTEATTAATTEVSETASYEIKREICPIRNDQALIYEDILSVLHKLEDLTYSFYPKGISQYYWHKNDESVPAPEYLDIEVCADETYSYGAIRPYTHDGSFTKLEGPNRLMHTKSYYKPVDGDHYFTKDDVYKALEDYITDSFIEKHFISTYEEVPGRNTVSKLINGELYISEADDVTMMVDSKGVIYNYDGNRCDVRSTNYSPDILGDPLRVSFVLEDDKWKIDGYVHLNNNDEDIRKNDPFPKEAEGEYNEICKKATDDLSSLVNVIFIIDVQTDENDTHIEEYDGTSVVYQRVTDERFSNVFEIENYICRYSIEDLRMRCIDYVRGEGKYSIPVYRMYGDELYCNVDKSRHRFLVTAYNKGYTLYACDENFIKYGLGIGYYNCIFLKKTADGWKMYDMD